MTLYHIMEKVIRPWGWYSATSEDNGFKTKILCVNPKHRLSLQSHAHRKELWSIISGEGICTVGDRTIIVSADSFVLIPRGEKHRIENTSDDTRLLVSEVQVGDVLSEDDIVRYDDDYGRRIDPKEV